MFGSLGPSGAGKTTTSRMLVTLLDPTAGRARVAGFDIATHPNEIRRVIGVALQDAGPGRLATRRELLVWQGRLYGLRERRRGGAPPSSSTPSAHVFRACAPSR